ncbi:MAG: aldo/keto reductase [Bacteroidales bacterium]|jgi:predicted aldo/keto reductase-like oxidoreductase|nr:aldo/keto reductase [Bacteroidales bacterium]
MKSVDKKKKITRRSMLAMLGSGIAASAAASSCSGERGKNSLSAGDGGTYGDMTYRTNNRSGDKVSLLGYGCMRFPLKAETIKNGDYRNAEIDQDAVQGLVDYAISHGVNYFDTAPIYNAGKSEIAIGKALSGYKRDSFYLATKMSTMACKSREDALEMFDRSFENCRTDYFDYYLLHALHSLEDYKLFYEEWGLLDFLLKKKKEGKIRNLGWSFHGDEKLFEYMLALPVKWDFVQIQMNYRDWLESRPPAKWMYEKLAERGIPVVIMEPLLGGRLADLNHNANAMLKEVHPDKSVASWAFRFAGSFPGVLCVLSGMTYMEHLKDNLKTFSPIVPLTEEEKKVLSKALANWEKYKDIPCTGCRYCMPCPYGVDIPGVFAYYNRCVKESLIPDEAMDKGYKKLRRRFLLGYDRSVAELSQADKCVACAQCVSKCPQHIPIPGRMMMLDKMVEKLKLSR